MTFIPNPIFYNITKNSNISVMNTKYLTILSLAVLFFGTSLSHAKRDEEVQQKVADAKEILLENDPSLKDWFKDAYGYALFSSVGKVGFGIGGAFGRGEVFEKGKFIGTAKLTQASFGFQAGGQAYIEVVFFENERNLRNFKDSNFTMAAQVSAVAATVGASRDAKYEHGVAVFTCVRGGLMYEASIGGQKFKFEEAD